MKLGGSGQVAGAVLLCAAVSHAGTGGSEAKLPEVEHPREAALRAAAMAGPLPLPRSATHLVLLDHEGYGAGDAGPEAWANAVAELKTEWDLTGMVDSSTAPAGSTVARKDKPQPSSGPLDVVVEATGSSKTIPASSEMAIEGYEDR